MTALVPLDLFAPIEGPKREKSAAEEQFDALAGKAPKRKQFALSSSTISKASVEADAMATAGTWDGARGVHLVALYAWMHREVYGVEASELSPTSGAGQKEWALAGVLAQRFCAQNFGGEMAECVEFMRWAWKREQFKERKRRNGEARAEDQGFRMGWRLQFSARLATDYRVDRARHP